MATAIDHNGGPMDVNAQPAAPSRLRLVAIGATVIITGYFLIESMLYRGLSEWINEWQFTVFGQAIPVITLMLLVTVFAGPIWLIYWAGTRKRRREAAAVVVPASDDRWRRGADRFRRLADGTAMVLAALAIGTLVWGSIVIGNAGRVIVAPSAPARPSQQVQTVVGTVDPRLAAVVSQGLLFSERTARYAPVIEPGVGQTVRYFVELPADPDAPAVDLSRPNLLFKGQLPGAARILFERSGVRVADERYVIARDSTGIRTPYWAGALVLLIVAVAAFIIARLQGRRIRKIVGAGPRKSA
ncbi:hypothetical protein NYR55_11510 [Sphingomonas sp. BGYR3]|uniref:hypothetical protein n=1 Tax=Sphingomonas sp. BGYR3 TaxID=2975483 RepID=UPI0021A48069|nr:hypothetical protein [Sphingomonas sp. BGYR3]MDG5489241.1 hypothetical protein [Sphingomonas sp. BGYR3]